MGDSEERTKIGNVMKNIMLNLKNGTMRAFMLWRLLNKNQNWTDKFDAKRKKKRVGAAVNKLQEMQNRRPRNALRSCNRHNQQQIKKDDCIKTLRKLFLMKSNPLGEFFFKWKKIFEEGLAVNNVANVFNFFKLDKIFIRRKSLVLRLLGMGVSGYNLKQLANVTNLISNFKLNREKVIDKAFYVWKALVAKDKHDLALSALTGDARIAEGVHKLMAMHHNHLRAGMRKVGGKAWLAVIVRNALVKTRLMMRRNLNRAFLLWARGTDLKNQKADLISNATTAMNLPTIKSAMTNLYRKPLRFAFNRIRDGPKKLLKRIGGRVNAILIGRLRKAMMAFLRNANEFKESRQNMMWKWKVASMAFSLGNQLTQQSKFALGANTIARIVNGAIMRDGKILLERVKRPKANIVTNLWKVMEKTRDVSMRKAWTIWSNCLYKDRADDWEHYYVQANGLQALVSHFGKFHQRSDFLTLSWAFGKWAESPTKTVMKAMARFRSDLHANLRRTLEIWRLKSKMMENAKLARIMFLIADRLGESSNFNKHYAFRLWAPNTMKIKVGASLKKLAIRGNMRLALAFCKWKENAAQVANERLH